MKTLIIHPHDKTTDFLSEIYKDKDWTVIKSNIGNGHLRRLIKDHDRIIMLGHGSENGLFGYDRMIIDSKYVQQLREKDCIGIWCNANIFFEKYGLKGFYTGMIVSELIEAYLYSLPTDYEMIEESNILFASAIKESIDTDDILENAKSKYGIKENGIIDFNKENLFYESR